MTRQKELRVFFDHIGIIVKDLPEGQRHFSELFRICRWTNVFEDQVNNVWAQFGEDQSGTCFELIAPLNEQSPIASALSKGTTILNHIAFLVTSIDTEVERLCALGCLPIGEPKPGIAYRGQRIQFLMSPLLFIFELIEAPERCHDYVENPTIVSAKHAV
jgi:methylmalonyl-CoA/ethylmalonyl-CoA epimerase